jgi:hypothetical protein
MFEGYPAEKRGAPRSFPVTVEVGLVTMGCFSTTGRSDAFGAYTPASSTPNWYEGRRLMHKTPRAN